jgi:hypothetical protein
MIAAPLPMSAFQDAIYDWASAQMRIDGVWANQDIARPVRSCFVLNRINSPIVLGEDELRARIDLSDAGREVKFDLVGQREFTVSLQVFADSQDPRSNAEAYLSLAQLSLANPDVIEVLDDVGLSIVMIGQIIRQDEIAGALFQSRAAMDITFGCTAYQQEVSAVGYIGSAEVTLTVAQDDGSTTSTVFDVAV